MNGGIVLAVWARHVNFCDLSGEQGRLGQVEGRTADGAAYWLLQVPPAWRDRVEVVALDMCTVFLAAVRREGSSSPGHP
jgi:transposase